MHRLISNNLTKEERKELSVLLEKIYAQSI
jgi:hypothetical protein